MSKRYVLVQGGKRDPKGRPVKAWVRGVPVDPKAKEQLLNTARLPFIHRWLAAMPDVHWGLGATVGSVIPTRKAIIPAAVGVDIGCGMAAMHTTLSASDLPDNLAPLRLAIEEAGLTDARITVGAATKALTATPRSVTPRHGGASRRVTSAFSQSTPSSIGTTIR